MILISLDSKPRGGRAAEIVKPAREVGEQGIDDSGHVLFDDAAGTRTGVEDVALGVGEDVVDRLAVTLGDDGFRVLVGERPSRRYLDLLGLNVRSKPATGAAFPGTVRRPPSGSPETGSESFPSMLKRCSSLTCEPFSTPFPPYRSARSGAEEDPGGVPVEA